MNIIGANSIVLGEVNSTNDYASNLLSHSKQIEGTIVLADYQTKGKGQGNNTWDSEKGENLLMSIILYPQFLDADKQFYLSMAISLGVYSAVKAMVDSEVSIKWPNDIYVVKNKISGILIKNTLSGEIIKTSIVGIGLNVNQIVFPEILKNTTSLRLENAIVLNKKMVFESLIRNLNHYYSQLLQGDYKNIKNKYERSLLNYNQLKMYETPNGDCFKGELKGVSDSGMLKININGAQKIFAHKEIFFKIDE